MEASMVKNMDTRGKKVDLTRCFVSDQVYFLLCLFLDMFVISKLGLVQIKREAQFSVSLFN